MKLVVDNSALESQSLAAFLSRRKENMAVLTETTAHETFSRGDRAVGMHQVLARHRGQVVVLKTLGELAELRPRSKGLLGRLIDPDETAAFPHYAERLVAGPGPLRDRLAVKRERARTYLDDLMAHVGQMRSELQNMLSRLSESEIKILKRDNRIELETIHLLTKTIGSWTRRSMSDALYKATDVRDSLWSFQFRFAVCMAALGIHWANKGGLDNRKPGRVRNDIADCAVSACATFFDGLLTEDRTQRDVHRLACQILNAAFRLPVTVPQPYIAPVEGQ